MFGLVDPKAIERTGAGLRAAGKISAFLAFEGMKRALCIFFRALFQDKIDILRFRRPQTEMSLVLANYLSADRISTIRPSFHELNPTQKHQTRSESLIKTSRAAQLSA